MSYEAWASVARGWETAKDGSFWTKTIMGIACEIDRYPGRCGIKYFYFIGGRFRGHRDCLLAAADACERYAEEKA